MILMDKSREKMFKKRMSDEKEWLKKASKKINVLKKEFKYHQSKGHGANYWTRVPNYYWRSDTPRYSKDWTEKDEKNYKEMRNVRNLLESLKYEYIVRHIAYSEVRGRKREEIIRPKEKRYGFVYTHEMERNMKIERQKMILKSGYYPDERCNSEISKIFDNMIKLL